MSACMVKRRNVTLIEMMIVMFIIAILTGVLAYNYRGSLEETKVFQTKTGMEKLETILNLEVAKNPELLEDIESNWQEVVRQSPLVKDAKILIHDGWGGEYDVKEEDGTIRVSSENYTRYLEAKGRS